MPGWRDRRDAGLDGLCCHTPWCTWPWGCHHTTRLAAPPAPGHELLPGLGGCGHELVGGDKDGQAPLPCHAMLCPTMPCWGKPCVVSDGAVGKEPRGVAFASRKELLISQPAGMGSILPRLQLTLSTLRGWAGKVVPSVTIPMKTLPCSMALGVMQERKKEQKEGVWSMKGRAGQAWVSFLGMSARIAGSSCPSTP